MRHQWMTAVALASAALIAGACGSERVPLPSAPRFATTASPATPSATSINSLITQLFPPPGLLTAAQSQFINIQRVLSQGNVADAQAKAVALVSYALQKYSNHQLIGNQSAATQSNLQSFISLLLQFVGLGPLPPGAVGPDGAVGVVGPAGGTVVTGSQLAGVNFPIGALPQTVVVTISLSANQTNPLPTVLQQFPLFYDFKTFPEVPQFGQLATVAVCVLDGPVADAGVNPANLRLAHQLHSDPSAIEILPLVPQNLVDPTLCQNAGTIGLEKSPMNSFASAGSTIGRDLFWLMMGAPRDLHAESRRMMMPGGLGGGVKSFSTFGAVNFTASEFVPFQEIGYRFLKLGPTDTPPTGFQQPSFDASAWSTGRGAFGGGSVDPTCTSLGSTIHTPWDTATTGSSVQILLRKRFSGTAQNVQVQVPIDNDVRVYVNGTEITGTGGTVDSSEGINFVPGSVDETGFMTHEGCADPAHPFVFTVNNSALLTGGNLVVVQARDRGVVSYVDVRVTGTLPSP